MKQTLIVIDGEAWGADALARIVEISREHPSLTVAASPDQKFIQTCEIWGEHAWFEAGYGWGIRIIGADAASYALIDAEEFRREVSDAVLRVANATVVSTTLGLDPPVVVSGPRYAEQAIWRGQTERLLYICLPTREEERRYAVGAIPNAHMIEFLPTRATPITRAA